MSIWDEIDERMEAAQKYERFRERLPWRWLPFRVRQWAYAVKVRHGAR